MKFKLKLEKEYEIDTDKDWGNDLDPLYEALKDCGVAPGDQANHKDIGEAIQKMLEDDIEYVIGDLDLDETHFTVEVPEGTVVEVPEEEDDAA